MARTRSVPIVESPAELEQLRLYYAGKPEAKRVLFLFFLSENITCTISDAANKVGISARRGRYWWDAYRENGLQGLLDRRVWRKSELDATNEVDPTQGASQSGSSHSAHLPWVAFLTALAINSREFSDAKTWMRGFRDALQTLLPDVDFIVVNIRHEIDVLRPAKGRVNVSREVNVEDQGVRHEMSTSDEGTRSWEVLIEQGKRAGFPFEKYHYPPTGFDYFLEPGKRERKKEDEDDSYIGSLLLFRSIGEPATDGNTLDLVERLRPFIVYAMTDFVVRASLASGSGGNLEHLVDRVAGEAHLTPQESRVLLLGFLGHSYSAIGEQLHVSVHTVQTHIRSIYRKTGISKLGEIYARFFTARQFPDSEESA